MRRLSCLSTLAAIWLVAAVSPASAIESSSECFACHTVARPELNHPVGIDYEQARRVIALRPSNAQSGFGSTVANDLLLNGRVECTSCHYTHQEDSTTPYRLRLPEPIRQPIVPGVRVVTTGLCSACHDTSRM